MAVVWYERALISEKRIKNLTNFFKVSDILVIMKIRRYAWYFFLVWYCLQQWPVTLGAGKWVTIFFANFVKTPLLSCVNWLNYKLLNIKRLPVLLEDKTHFLWKSFMGAMRFFTYQYSLYPMIHLQNYEFPILLKI